VPAADEARQAVPAPSETEPLSEKETARVCKAFFASLTPEERRLFRLRFQKRMKHREIAARLGISEGAVKVRVFRLKEKAKAQIRRWAEKDP
jgi:RNA polymerase sigma factor (sigma-70 family)